MKRLHVDSVGGASGDMLLGALVDLGVDPVRIQTELARFLPDAFDIEAQPFESHGIRGTRVAVRASETDAHRTLGDIRALIEPAPLPAPVKERSLAVFTRLAEAEAHVHGTTADQVHFHEVGAIDSIVDIVGVCLGLHELGVESISVGPLPAGTGTLVCRHGIYPNPAPATLELLKGVQTVPTDEPFELVTPTGAALLTVWSSLEKPSAGGRLVGVGYGFGHHLLQSRPNLLRASLFEDAPENGKAGEDDCLVLECNLDDTTPELVGALLPRLLEAGARDAFTTAIQMKKQRPGVLLTVLCRSDRRDAVLDLLFRESTTFGVREYSVRRTVLKRQLVEVTTPYGRVRVKVGRWRGDEVTAAPEMEDCIRLAAAANVAVRRVYEAASAAAHARPASPSDAT